jgi:hypothetical protein
VKPGVAPVHAGAGVITLFLTITLAVSVSGCGQLQGFGGPATPLVTFNVEVTGDLTPLLPAGATSPHSLQVALVWGAQWLTEPLCVLPAENAAAAAVIAAGCRDPFAFVPALVAANVPVSIGTPASFSLFDLPGADVMVGDLTSRVAYGSLVVYDDLDDDRTLDVAAPHRTRGANNGPGPTVMADSPDIVYGASFITMTAPDQRVAFSEGTFNAASAFYPRSGCAAPPSARFSILAAGGFSSADGLAAAITGRLPPEDPTTCREWDPPDSVVVTFGVQSPASVQEVSCVQRSDDSSIRYREPTSDAPDFSGRATACAHLPSFDAGDQTGLIQLVVSGRPGDRCKGLTHYTLRGCRENVACPVPDWDYTATPPAWWPCPQ